MRRFDKLDRQSVTSSTAVQPEGMPEAEEVGNSRVERLWTVPTAAAFSSQPSKALLS